MFISLLNTSNMSYKMFIAFQQSCGITICSLSGFLYPFHSCDVTSVRTTTSTNVNVRTSVVLIMATGIEMFKFSKERLHNLKPEYISVFLFNIV